MIYGVIVGKKVSYTRKRYRMNNIQNLIISNYSKFTESDKYVAKYILNNSEVARSSTIEDLAETCSVSKSTIIRFTKKLGLDGFSELKVLLKINSMELENISLDFIERISEKDIQIVNYFTDYDFLPIVKMLDEAPTIYAYGTGSFQRSFIKEFQRLFMHIGIWVRIIDSHGEFNVAINMMKENDSIVIVSSSGENEFLDRNYNLLKLKGVGILSFTNSANNSLAYASNYNISTELNKETFYDQYYFDNIATMYTPLKLLFA